MADQAIHAAETAEADKGYWAANMRIVKIGLVICCILRLWHCAAPASERHLSWRNRSRLLVCPARLDPCVPGSDLFLRLAYEQTGR